jgi:hypothetical protein
MFDYVVYVETRCFTYKYQKNNAVCKFVNKSIRPGT